MKIVATTLIVALAASSASAFSVQPASKVVAVGSALSMSTVAEPEVEEAAAAPVTPTPAAPKSGMTMQAIKKSIDRLSKENFSSTLDSLEPYLLNEAGGNFYAKCMRRIARQAKHLGVEMPADYAKEAKATEKRRLKQDAFIKAKLEELAAASESEEPVADVEAPAEEEEASE
jgi:hypothetical protein